MEIAKKYFSWKIILKRHNVTFALILKFIKRQNMALSCNAQSQPSSEVKQLAASLKTLKQPCECSSKYIALKI